MFSYYSLGTTASLVFIALLLLAANHAQAVQLSPMAQLVKDLFTNSPYDPHQKPTTNETLVVSLGLAFQQLISVDERNQVVSARVWMRMKWHDAHIKWDPADYNGIKMIHLPQHMHWKPDIVLYNNANQEFQPMFNDMNTLAYHDGSIWFPYPAVVQFSCTMDIVYFPYDEQTCHLKFGSWSYDASMVDLIPFSGVTADTKDFAYNSEWALVSFSYEKHMVKYGCCPELYPDITFYFTIRRRFVMHVFYLVMPNILINIIATLQFMLPCDSGEKVTLGITVLLAMLVDLLLVAELLPSTESIPLIGKYIGATMGLVSISQVVAVIVLHLHHNGMHDNHSRLPHWARVIFLHGLARLLCLHQYITSDTEHEIKLQTFTSKTLLSNEDLFSDPSDHWSNTSVRKPSMVSPTTDRAASAGRWSRPRGSAVSRGGLDMTKESSILLMILRHIEEHKEKNSQDDKDQELRCEWQQLAMVIDRLLFYIFMMLNVLVVVIVFSSRPYHNDPIIK